MMQRNPIIAKSEAQRGMNHAFFWLAFFRHAMRTVEKDAATNWRDHFGMSDGVTAQHSQVFTDTVTGKSYRLTVEEL